MNRTCPLCSVTEIARLWIMPPDHADMLVAVTGSVTDTVLENCSAA